jgi:hypothetical protein
LVVAVAHVAQLVVQQVALVPQVVDEQLQRPVAVAVAVLAGLSLALLAVAQLAVALLSLALLSLPRVALAVVAVA